MILYQQDEQAFNTNGLGILSDCTKCAVERELNGMYALEMEYPTAGIHAEKIVTGCIILVPPDPYSRPQPFRIWKTRRKRSSNKISVWARHIAYDAEGTTVLRFEAEGAADSADMINNVSVYERPVRVTTNKASSAIMRQEKPKSMMKSVIGSEGSFVDTFGGEIEMDFFAIRILERIGTDNHVTIRPGKNLTDAEIEVNAEKYFSGVYPFWEKDGVYVTCGRLDSKAPSGTKGTLTLDLTDEFDSEPAPTALQTRAERYIRENDIGKISVAMTVNLKSLETEPGMEWMMPLERVQLGDTVRVILDNPQTLAESRVVAVSYDPLANRYNHVSVGEIKKSLAGYIAGIGG